MEPWPYYSTSQVWNNLLFVPSPPPAFLAVPQFPPVQQPYPVPHYPMQPWPYYYNPPATSQDSHFDYQSLYGYVWYNPLFFPSPPPSFSAPVDFVDGVANLVPGEDVDYEDRFELEEQGLSEETISEHLKTSPAHVASKNMEEDGELCVVRQDGYQPDETIATLHGGHCYHADCIKEWLLHKNVYPICKATALNL